MNETILSVWFYLSTGHGEIDNDLIQITDNLHELISLPMESLMISYLNKILIVYECYTLFSHSHLSWNNIKINFKYIHLLLKLDPHSMPIGPAFTIPIMMHSPNALPFDNYYYFSPGYYYSIGYSQWNIERLGKGYETDCRKYEPKKYARSDCIFDCYQDRVKSHCLTQDFVASTLLKRKIYFEKRDLNLNKCIVSDEIQFESIKSCADQCHKECHFTYYSFKINKYLKYGMHQACFQIKHNEMTDLTIRYIPEMPLLTFICNYGGILGMWLGVSFYSIFEIVWKILRANILSKISFTININNIKNKFITNYDYSRRISQLRMHENH